LAPLPSFNRPQPLDFEGAEPLTVEPVEVGDDFESLVSLFELPRNSPTRILEGELQFLDAAATYRAQKPGSPKPPSTASGIGGGGGAARTFGPNSPWRLDALWVRNTQAGQVARAAFVGWVI
jgi:hypothetical protein